MRAVGRRALLTTGRRGSSSESTRTDETKMPFCPGTDRTLVDNKVESLMNMQKTGWETDNLKDLFAEGDVILITKIPVAETKVAYQVIWMGEKNGYFSVSSCYRMLQENLIEDIVPTWARMRNLKLPLKVEYGGVQVPTNVEVEKQGKSIVDARRCYAFADVTPPPPKFGSCLVPSCGEGRTAVAARRLTTQPRRESMERHPSFVAKPPLPSLVRLLRRRRSRNAAMHIRWKRRMKFRWAPPLPSSAWLRDSRFAVKKKRNTGNRGNGRHCRTPKPRRRRHR
nr:uncharacterized protein LOC109177106 [Ipomoea trifida]